MDDNPLLKELDPGDSVFATGNVCRRFDKLRNPESTGLLVHTGEGSYYLLDESQLGKTEIHGVIHELIYVKYIGLVTDFGVIGFWPLFFQEDNLLNDLKDGGELEILQQCPVCNLTRPVDEVECSNPGCAAELAKIEKAREKSHDEGALARASCIIGGGGGFLAGLILLGIVYIIAWILDAPLKYRALMLEYWWVLPGILGAIGVIGLQILGSREENPQKDNPGG